MEKFLVCPQCGIDRFYILDSSGKRLLVKVNRNLEIIPLNPDEKLDGFDTETLHCLGCSWKGSKNKLVKYVV